MSTSLPTSALLAGIANQCESFFLLNLRTSKGRGCKSRHLTEPTLPRRLEGPAAPGVNPLVAGFVKKSKDLQGKNQSVQGSSRKGEGRIQVFSEQHERMKVFYYVNN